MPWKICDVDAFEVAWEFLMELEGRDLLHKIQGDPGGRTRFGMAEEKHPAEWVNGPPTEASARRFYLRVYWGPLRLAEVESPVVASEIFEFAVNTTTPTPGSRVIAVAAAQSAANAVRVACGWEKIGVDGRMGPETIGALNRLGRDPLSLLAWEARQNLHQLDHYRTRRKELVARFLAGWTRRVLLLTPGRVQVAA